MSAATAKALRRHPETRTPLEIAADDLLIAIRYKRARRGDAILTIQRVVLGAVEAMAREVCGGCRLDFHEDEDGCAAGPVWRAWDAARPTLWGPR